MPKSATGFLYAKSLCKVLLDKLNLSYRRKNLEDERFSVML